jgi:hypothetical protein
MDLLLGEYNERAAQVQRAKRLKAMVSPPTG